MVVELDMAMYDGPELDYIRHACIALWISSGSVVGEVRDSRGQRLKIARFMHVDRGPLATVT